MSLTSTEPDASNSSLPDELKQAPVDGPARTLAGWTKRVTGLPVIAIGSVGVAQAFREAHSRVAPPSRAAPLELFEGGEFGLVALGRALLSEPAWPTKLRTRRLNEIRRYDKTDESAWSEPPPTTTYGVLHT